MTDGQALVEDTTQSPFNTIGRLQITVNSTVGALCTGALIAPTVVLTAGHCWFDPDSGQTNQAASFSPGYTITVTSSNRATRVQPYGTANVRSVKLPSAFTSCPTKGYSTCFAQSDFAIAFLDTSFTSTFAYGYSNSFPSTETVYTAGYPGDKCYSQDFSTCPMWYTACKGSSYSDAGPEGQDACLSGEGQSGSPMWIEPSSSSQAVVVGILSSTPFNSKTVAADGETETLYTSISPAVYSELSSWIASGANTQDTGVTKYTFSGNVPASSAGR